MVELDLFGARIDLFKKVFVLCSELIVWPLLLKYDMVTTLNRVGKEYLV